MKFIPFLAFIFYAHLVASVAVAQTTTGRAYVIDGDSLRIEGQKIQLYGVVALDRGRTCLDANGWRYRPGEKAIARLRELVGQHNVICESIAVGADSRMTSRCRAAGVDLAGALVAEGWAHSSDKAPQYYQKMEKSAEASGRGIWQGECLDRREPNNSIEIQ